MGQCASTAESASPNQMSSKRKEAPIEDVMAVVKLGAEDQVGLQYAACMCSFQGPFRFLHTAAACPGLVMTVHHSCCVLSLQGTSPGASDSNQNRLWAKKRVAVTAEGAVASQVCVVPKHERTKKLIGEDTSACTCITHTVGGVPAPFCNLSFVCMPHGTAADQCCAQSAPHMIVIACHTPALVLHTTSLAADVIRDNLLFQDLPAAALEIIIDSMHSVNVAPGTDIIRQVCSCGGWGAW